MLNLLVVLTGLMAGMYFAFSTVIMKSFDQLEPLRAGQAMNKINDVIVNTIFLPMFFGSTVWYAGLLVWTFAHWQHGRSTLIIAASLIYIAGMFFVTAFGNVPLNNTLKSYEKSEAELARYWPVYMRSWTRLNHVRSLSCVASCLLLLLALN